MLTMPHWPVPNWLPVIHPGLERIQALLDALGNPERHLPPTIHVAGTNGKGSTVAYLRAIFEASGRCIHSYTSPHLVQFNERIMVQGKEIADDILYSLLEECRLACEKHQLQVTFFEGTTAAAFLAFARYPADILILETGMGGRLDATNVIPTSIATVITPISYDHTEFLGTHLHQIALEKAGIMRPGTPCISSLQTDEVEDVLQQVADGIQAPFIAYGYDWGVLAEEDGMYFKSATHAFRIPKLALAGPHQWVNAGAAIATALLALPHYELSQEVVLQGLAKAHWPGRLQHLESGHLTELLPEGYQLWVDGAHNVSGSQALATWLDTEPVLPTGIILGMTKKRNVQAFLSPLQPHIQHVVGVLVEAEPSAYPGDYIANQAAAINIANTACSSIKAAISQLTTILPPPARILITGSLYLVGDALVLHHGYNAIS